MAESSNVWKRLDEAKADLVKRAEALNKKAFIEMPGGQMPPAGDPSAAGGMPPEMAGAMPPGGAPMDPAAMGGMPPDAAGAMPPGGDPAMGGMDPAMLAAMAGGGAPLGVDPATAGMLGGAGGMPPDAAAGGALAGGGGAGTPEPTITITLSQLWDVVTKVLGLAKKIGANGQGVAAESAAPAAPAAPAGQDAIKAAVIEALGDMGLTR